MKNLFKTASVLILLLLALTSCDSNRVIKIEGDNNIADVVNLPSEIKKGDTISVWYNSNRERFVFQRLHTKACAKAVVLR